MRFGCCCFLDRLGRSVGEQELDLAVRLRLWNTRLKDTVERWRGWRSEPSLPESLVEHEERSLARCSVLLSLLELSKESPSVERRDNRRPNARRRRPPRGADIGPVISSIGGHTTILGAAGSRRPGLGSVCWAAVFPGRSPANSLATKSTISLFFISSTKFTTHKQNHSFAEAMMRDLKTFSQIAS